VIRFTKDEKKIIIFLLIALFIGISVLGYKKLNPQKNYSFEFNEKEIEESKKININAASRERLAELVGIGPVMADRIARYRQEHGPFEHLEDIKNVKGIGDKTFDKIKRWIVLK